MINILNTVCVVSNRAILCSLIQAHAPASLAAGGGLFFGIFVCQWGRAGGRLKGMVPAHPRPHHCFALRASRLQSFARWQKKGSVVPPSVFFASQLHSFRLQALRASQSCGRRGPRGAATSPQLRRAPLPRARAFCPRSRSFGPSSRPCSLRTSGCSCSAWGQSPFAGG